MESSTLAIAILIVLVTHLDIQVETLQRTDESHAGYLRLYNGSIILSQQLAYVHQGYGKHIHRKVTLRQPITVKSIADGLERMLALNDIQARRCDDFSARTNFEHVQQFSDPNDNDKPSGLVIVSGSSDHLPTEVEADCERLGMRVPEPDSPMKLRNLGAIMADKQLEHVIISGEYKLGLQTFVSRYTGKPIEETYQNLWKTGSSGHSHLNTIINTCYPTNWRYHLIYNNMNQMTFWQTEHRKPMKQGDYFLSTKYQNWPGYEPQDGPHDDRCTNFEHRTRKLYGKFPVICEVIRSKQPISADFRKFALDQFKYISNSDQELTSSMCHARTETQKRMLLLILRDFNDLIAELGISNEFMQNLIDYIPEKEVHVTLDSGRKKRGLRSILRIAGKSGIFGIGGGIISAFLDAKKERLVDAKIDDLEGIASNVRQLSYANSVKLDQLKQETEETTKVLQAKITFLDAKGNLTNALALVESSIQYLAKEIDVFRNLIRQTSRGEVPEYVSLITQELNIKEILSYKYPTTSNAELAADLEQPIIMMSSRHPGQFELLVNYVLLTSEWDFYTIIPIPAFEEEYRRVRKVPFKHIALDFVSDEYVPIDERQMQECLNGQCVLKGTRQRVQNEECVVSPIMGDKPKHFKCPVEYFSKSNFFYPTPYGVIYSVDKPLTAHAVCPDSKIRGIERRITFKGIGMIQINPGCFVKTHEPDLARFIPRPTTDFINVSKVIDALDIVNNRLILDPPPLIDKGPKNNGTKTDNPIDVDLFVKMIASKTNIMWKILYTIIGVVSFISVLVILVFVAIFYFKRKAYTAWGNFQKNVFKYVDTKWHLSERVMDSLNQVKRQFSRSRSVEDPDSIEEAYANISKQGAKRGYVKRQAPIAPPLPPLRTSGYRGVTSFSSPSSPALSADEDNEEYQEMSTGFQSKLPSLKNYMESLKSAKESAKSAKSAKSSDGNETEMQSLFSITPTESPTSSPKPIKDMGTIKKKRPTD